MRHLSDQVFPRLPVSPHLRGVPAVVPHRCADGRWCRGWARLGRSTPTGTGLSGRRSVRQLVRGGNSGFANAAGKVAPVITQNGLCRRISVNWPRASTQVTQADPSGQAWDAPNVCLNCAHAVGFPYMDASRIASRICFALFCEEVGCVRRTEPPVPYRNLRRTLC